MSGVSMTFRSHMAATIINFMWEAETMLHNSVE